MKINKQIKDHEKRIRFLEEVLKDQMKANRMLEKALHTLHSLSGKMIKSIEKLERKNA